MYKKIETCNWCDIYKHTDAGIYIATFGKKRISKGSYLDVTNAITKFANRHHFRKTR